MSAALLVPLKRPQTSSLWPLGIIKGQEPGAPTLGSFSVWSLNMTALEPTVKLFTAIREAKFLNVAAFSDGLIGTVLIAHAVLGAI